MDRKIGLAISLAEPMPSRNKPHPAFLLSQDLHEFGFSKKDCSLTRRRQAFSLVIICLIFFLFTHSTTSPPVGLGRGSWTPFPNPFEFFFERNPCEIEDLYLGQVSGENFSVLSE